MIGKALDLEWNHWGGPSLTGYPCEDLPSKTTRNRLLTINDGISPKTRPQML